MKWKSTEKFVYLQRQKSLKLNKSDENKSITIITDKKLI